MEVDYEKKINSNISLCNTNAIINCVSSLRKPALSTK